MAACAPQSVQTRELTTVEADTGDPLERAKLLYKNFNENVFPPRTLSEQESIDLAARFNEGGWDFPVFNPDLQTGVSRSEVPIRTSEEIDALVKNVIFPKILEYPAIEYYSKGAESEARRMKAEFAAGNMSVEVTDFETLYGEGAKYGVVTFFYTEENKSVLQFNRSMWMADKKPLSTLGYVSMLGLASAVTNHEWLGHGKVDRWVFSEWKKKYGQGVTPEEAEKISRNNMYPHEPFAWAQETVMNWPLVSISQRPDVGYSLPLFIESLMTSRISDKAKELSNNGEILNFWNSVPWINAVVSNTQPLEMPRN